LFTFLLNLPRAYIAPEYLAEGTVSKKKDVYAFGITLLEAVGSIRMFKPPSECRLDEWVMHTCMMHMVNYRIQLIDDLYDLLSGLDGLGRGSS
jgi:hypothetical protein